MNTLDVSKSLVSEVFKLLRVDITSHYSYSRADLYGALSPETLLCSNMTQSTLYHNMLLHILKERTDKILLPQLNH